MLRIIGLILLFSLLSTYIFASVEDHATTPMIDFIWKVLNVIVLVAIIYKFAKKPVKTALSNNAKLAKQLMDEAKETEEKITSNLSDMRSKISDIEKEAVEMVESAKKDAESEKNRIIEEGKKEISRMTEQARFVLKQENRKAENELRHWIAEESVKLAEVRLKEELNHKNQKKLVEKYTDQLKKIQGVL